MSSNKQIAPLQHRFRHTLCAFALIELLVVIAVIGILLSILLPSLRQAKETAKRAQCMTNLHHVGYALAMYAKEYGRYPHQRQSAYNSGGLTVGGPYVDRYYRGPLPIPLEAIVGWEWDEVIRLGIDDGYTADATVPFNASVKILSCPNIEEEYPYRETYWPNGTPYCGYSGNERPDAYNWFPGYMYVGGMKEWVYSSPSHSPRFMRDPGSWAMMADKLFYQSTEDRWTTGHPQGNEPAGFNTLFHDQHVTWYSWADGTNATKVSNWGKTYHYWRRTVDAP